MNKIYAIWNLCCFCMVPAYPQALIVTAEILQLINTLIMHKSATCIIMHCLGKKTTHMHLLILSMFILSLV